MATVTLSFAQGRADEFLGIPRWRGTLTITGTTSGNGLFSDQWQYSVNANTSFQITRASDPSSRSWTGALTGNATVNFRDVTPAGDCTSTRTFTAAGAVGAPPDSLFMEMLGDNQYSFWPGLGQVNGTNATVFECPGVRVADSNPGAIAYAPLSDLVAAGFTLPATGFSLTGSQAMNIVLGPGITARVTVQWDFEPDCSASSSSGRVAAAVAACAPPELVVPVTAEFTNFRPTAGDNGARGNSISLTAKLQAAGGGPLNLVADHFIWEFTRSSKEPGYAMNAPLASAGRSDDPDLVFESGPDALTIKNSGLRAESVPGGRSTQSTVIIASYDWGGFGSVKVTAVLTDGSSIVGHLEGDPTQTEIRVPKRPPGGLIADVWKQTNGVTASADSADNENSPVGDGHTGDGFTLYEEYRGFIVDGQHEEGDPNRKDFFILNTAGCGYLAGIKLFESLSGLKVHYNLKRDEMEPSRVMNGNWAAAAHGGDQHGIIIVPIAADAKYSNAIGGPGTPLMVRRVQVQTLEPGASPIRLRNAASLLAHELFHACNVYHHGSAADLNVSWLRVPFTDIVLENITNPILVLDESGSSAAGKLPFVATDRIIAVANDSHTGDDDCVMRYTTANWYISKTIPATVRYHVDVLEPAGFGLCTSAVGTGVNAATHLPQPRYGDAAPGLGNCRGQILVNDAIPAPVR